MKFNPVIVGYVPPPTFGQPRVFLENVAKFPAVHPLLLFSDHDWPGVIKVLASPEIVKGMSPNKWLVNNFIFFTAMRVAMRHNATHVLYLEADSRVGPDWDTKIFTEFFELPMPPVCAGSMVCYNPTNAGLAAQQRWAEVVNASMKRRNFPIPTYGFKGAADDSGSCVYVNGSLGVYDMAWMRRLFGTMEYTPQLARDCTAWDMEIGVRIWPIFGIKSYDMVAHLHSIYSSFGNVLTTESERMAMLRKGDVVAVHQVKSSATMGTEQEPPVSASSPTT